MDKSSYVQAFNKLGNREKLDLLHKLSQPWIEKGAITVPAKDITEILALQARSAGAVRNVFNQIDTNKTIAKKKRKKR